MNSNSVSFDCRYITKEIAGFTKAPLILPIKSMIITRIVPIIKAFVVVKTTSVNKKVPRYSANSAR